MKAIETRYNGYRFRSRLEARWAVYFDADGIKWDYEVEGFQLRSGLYLPDFWLPQVKMYAEVKPAEFFPHELQKARELTEASGFPVLLLDGPPDVRSYFAWDADRDHYEDYTVSSYHGYNTDEGRFYSTAGGVWPTPARGRDVDGILNLSSIAAARGARFEHGEIGRALPVQSEIRRAPTLPENPTAEQLGAWNQMQEARKVAEQMNEIDRQISRAADRNDDAEMNLLIDKKVELHRRMVALGRQPWKSYQRPNG
jgi:hypothetical protein